MTNFRALCAELVYLDEEEVSDWTRKWADAVKRTKAALAQPEPQGLMPEVDDILRLAAIIRRVDGNHDKGAAALAEAILRHPDSRWQHAQPEPQGPTDEEIDDWHGRCADLTRLGEADHYWAFDLQHDEVAGVVRAALARWGRRAQPEPQGPTDEEWDALWDEESEYFALYAEARRFGRAVWNLARR